MCGRYSNTFIGDRTGASSNLCLRFGIKGLFLLGMGLQYYNMPYYGYSAGAVSENIEQD